MKIRIDELLVQKNIAPTRSQAKQLIQDGKISYKGEKITKPGIQVSTEIIPKLEEGPQYVGRGAQKLEGAIKEFNVDLNDKVIADIGASTGGFTDYTLQHGAQKVYAIDVGHGQLAEKLCADPRVINMEGINIRDEINLPEKADYAVVDLSYISITLALPNIAKLLKKEGKIIALIKPQFEAGPGVVGKDGVIRDEEKVMEIINNFKAWCAANHFQIQKIIPSPITGKMGNKEFLALITFR
jgi:23S rRNA (cytidine1920-2'-O)/16S rRNA (cytidine1409-2'-O)-methyltransferase